MNAGVNKERCRPRKFACIYLWISVVRTIRQLRSEFNGGGDSVGLLEYILRLLSPAAAIGVERSKPTTLDLTRTVRARNAVARHREYCS